MHLAGDRALLLEHLQQLLLQIEAVDHGRRAHTQLIEHVAAQHALVERLGVADTRQIGQYTLNGLGGVTAGTVIDGHVQLEVVGVDVQLVQLEGTDQQVQRQLFIAEVVADHFGQELVGQQAQRQLDGALAIQLIIQFEGIITALASQQTLVEQHVILRRDPVAKLFQVGTHQRIHTIVAPVGQNAV